ncbi:uncharacterized protein LOC134672158 [Cydia fagiglandana]|uniref:uncharacterized protein LOC134672158 n=1 Tax=Cydia fagiglandana TaxID=1458189 RepID=UPI002FEDFA7F
MDMLSHWLIISALLCGLVNGQFGPFRQDSGYVTVRQGAHMFYWLFYTTADVSSYTDRPLVVWLQGGPGGSSTGIGNFEILGPLDLSLQERNYTWVKNFNVLFVDNPVGTGYSYVDDWSYLTTTNDEIAVDFVNLMRGFYEAHSEFEGIPLYIYGQSYGGKMAVDMGIRMHEAEQAGTIRSNLRGIAMGNAWIHPVDLTLTWGPLLLAAGLADETGYQNIQVAAREAERLFDEGLYVESTAAWAATQRQVFLATHNVDFYNILTKTQGFAPDTRTDYEIARELMIRDMSYSTMSRQEEYNLSELMNGPVKEALGIPAHVAWGSQANAVFDRLRGDFMKPVTEGIEKLLNETDIIVQKYNGNLDLICDTPGQLLWMDRLQWAGTEAYRSAQRQPIWEDNRLEGYYKSYGNLRFFWINVAGHSVTQSSDCTLQGPVRFSIPDSKMVKRAVVISVTAGVLIAGGLAVLIWWLVAGRDPFRTVQLNNQAVGNVEGTAALTRIRGSGDMFWWFFPAHDETPASRPIILWLDGVTGVSPSLLANTLYLQVDQYNLLFVDAPIGTGFSAAQSDSTIPDSLDENIDHLVFTLESFYELHEGFNNAPLYIFGQGHGSKLALALTTRLLEDNELSHNLAGIALGNGIVSPALALTKLSFYLYELGYVDEDGRTAIDNFSKETNDLVDNGQLGAAFDHFLSLGEYTNENAGSVAVNLGHIVEKLTRDARQGYFGQPNYLDNVFGLDSYRFMDEAVAPALGISGTYAAQQDAAARAFRTSFMESDIEKIEYILENTSLRVTIYNGNLDAVSNTPGQLEWVNALRWSGQQSFLASPRSTLIVNGLVQGYFRETERLSFYWVNAAGQSVPLDSPDAMRRILDRITGS